MRTDPRDALLRFTEKEWDAYLFKAKEGVAPSLGWISYHTLRSKGSQPGFPDRTLFRDRVIFVELKREKEKPTERQTFWLDGLAGAGAEAYLWRPSDLDEVGRILGRRWGFLSRPTDEQNLPHLAHFELGAWTPPSLWISGKGRAGDAGLAG